MRAEVIAAAVAWLGFLAWMGVGALVWLVLALGGFKRFDANAAAAPWRVKLLLLPGAALLWPWMIARFLGARPREDRAMEDSAS